MTDNRDIYTYPLNEQSAAEAFNTILWRVGVAAGILERGQKDAIVDVDDLLEGVELVLEVGAAYAETAVIMTRYPDGKGLDVGEMLDAEDRIVKAITALMEYRGLA